MKQKLCEQFFDKVLCKVIINHYISVAEGDFSRLKKKKEMSKVLFHSFRLLQEAERLIDCRPLYVNIDKMPDFELLNQIRYDDMPKMLMCRLGSSDEKDYE